MSDEKYTEKEREFLRLHELEHTLYSIERTVIEQFGERCPDYEATCIVCRAWKALDVLREVLFGADVKQEYGEAADMIINKALAEDNDE